MTAAGQTESNSRAAETVVREAFDAYASMRWDAVAALIHPEALRSFHRWQIEHHRMREETRDLPPEERRGEGMPAEVQAWFDEQRRRLDAARPSELAADFAGVTSLAELEALAPGAAFARWLEAHDARVQLLRTSEATGHPMPPGFPLDQLHPAKRIVGSVAENDSTVQVLYRTSLPGEADADGVWDQLAIATVRRAPAGWRIWTTRRDPELFGIENWYIGLEPPEEGAERLRASASQVFLWPEGASPRVRASVQGYAGDGNAPEAVWLEVVRPDGSVTRIEIPYEALAPLWEYLQPWMYLPDRAQP